MKLSIIVSIYNMDKFLIKSLNSIIDNIGIDDYECILIDGGSTDNSGKYCYEYQKKDKHITYIKLNEYEVNEIYNIGLDISIGEYLYFIDGYNILCKNFLNEGIQYLDNNKNIDVYIRNYQEYNGNNLVNVYSCFENTGYGPTLSSCIFRKSAINVRFQDALCSNIIFTGKVIYSKNKYFFDKNNNSFINNVTYKGLNNFDYVKDCNLNWQKYVIDEISHYIKRKFDLSYHVIDKCNKNCIACGHFSPLTPDEDTGVSVEQFESDMKLASFLKPSINSLILTGGEPTLNKNLLEIIKIALKYFDNIRLCSNGLNKKFFIDNADFLNNNNISVFITRYSLENFDDIKSLLKHASFYTIPSLEDNSGKRTLFNCKHLSKLKVNVDRKFYCNRGACVQLRDKKLYLCQYTANFHLFKNYFKDINFPFNDEDTYIDLSKTNNIEEVLDFIFYCYPKICEYCRQPLYGKSIDVNTVELTKSKNDLKEWFD